MPTTATERGVSTVLTLDNLDVAVGGRALLSRLTLALNGGGLTALAGPSGCGKTTLLRCIAGLRAVERGEVRLDGRLPAEIGWPEFRRRVVLVQQTPALLEGTVEANLRRPWLYCAATDGFPEQRARSWLSLLQLDERVWTQNARSLSVGQQQRVSLVRALLIAPEVVLLDEPTSALDAAAAEAVRALVLAQVEQGGLAVLLVTHDRALAAAWGARLVDLRETTGEERAGRPYHPNKATGETPVPRIDE